MWSDADLYRRGAETLLASWEEYARGASGASVRRFPGVAAAVFPIEPERAVYNNALLQLELTPAERADALDAMEATYSGAGVTRFAAWVHESDEAMRAQLERRGYALDTWTRAMSITLDDIHLSRPDIELGLPDWSEYLRIIGVPPGFLSRADQAAFHVLVARIRPENVATAMAFDHANDYGIYNVTTLAACTAARTGHGAARGSICTTHSSADARQQAFSRPKSPSASTSPRASAISAGSSNTCCTHRPRKPLPPRGHLVPSERCTRDPPHIWLCDARARADVEPPGSRSRDASARRTSRSW